MSNFLNSYYTNLNDLTTINATDVNSQVVNTNQLNLTGGIYNGGNIITFTPTTNYTNFLENVHIYKNLYLDYQGSTLNVGQLLISGGGGGSGQYPSITYDASLNITTFTGGMVFPSNSIASSSINNDRFVDLSSNQIISNKQFSGTTIFSSIQLNDDLLVNSGGTTILNSNLALINFLSGTSSNINTRFTTNETNISTLTTKLTNQTFSDSTTTWTGSVSFPANSIASASINNSSFVALTGNQSVGGVKTYNSNAIFTQTLRLDNSLLVGTAGATIVTNAQLMLIPDIGTLNSKTQYLTFTTNNSTFSQTLNADNFNFTGNINNTFTKVQFDNAINFSKSASSDLQLQINSINTNLSGYALQSSLQAVLDEKIGTMIYYEPTDFTIVNNFLTNGELQYTPDGSTKINLIPIINTSADKLLKVSRNEEFNFFDINSNCHIYGKLQLGNYPDVEYSLNAVITAEGITAGFTAGNTTAIAYLINTTIPAMNLVTAGIALDVTGLETDVGALQQKTQKISYDVQDNTTTISAITSIYNLRVGNLESGLIQTENLNVRFIGVTEIRNDFIITNGFGADIDGGINQLHANAVSTFAGALTVNNNFTSGGTNTNINSTNCTITGTTTIRLNTQNPILNVVLPSTVGAFNAQGILIGKEQTNGQARNCNIGYNYYQDGHANNYGYLGLNVMAGAGNLRESFRWFDGGCSIPVGNLTITEGNLSLQGGKITSTTGNIELTSGKLTLGTGNIELTSGNITSTNGGITLSNGSLTLTTGSMTATNGDVNLTNGDLNIVNGDATFSNGNLTLGSGDIGITNGDLNILNGELKTNTINKYSGTTLDVNSNGVGSSMNINSPQINIGSNQGIGALNVINVGSSSSISTIYLNGIVSSAFGFNLTGSVLQW